MATYVKVMLGLPLSSASRNKHELSAAYEAGYDVVVFCGEGGFPEEQELSRYKIICRGMLEAKGSSRLTHWINILREWNRFRKELKAVRPDVISCHNLTNLFPVWAVTRFMHPRPRLIYDCHEFTMYDAYSNRSAGEAKKTRKREEMLMKRSDISIVVNDSIADAMQEEYKLQRRPTVIRSIPPCWKLDENVLRERRREMCRMLQAPEDSFLAIYHGMINKKRGTEVILDAIALEKDIRAVFLGNGDVDALLASAKEKGVQDRVLCLPAVPVTSLWQYVGAADVGVMPIQNTCKSYYLCLPNKFFETVQSGIPLICSDFPEMGKLVRQYGIGLLCDPADPAALGSCLRKMRTDREFYSQCRRNLCCAREELCWEKEKTVLLDAYHKYL